ncbi:MAG: NAD(P)-dependent oxidoreductase [bacterium]|nr:NAD(P)-dependent oxidoreductase [bacterium]
METERQGARTLVTGSAGHLGEALVRVLRARGREVVGLDRIESPFTSIIGSVADRDCVRRALDGVETVLHTATLHKPHVESHSREAFVETNISGTLALLEESAAAGVRSFVFTSTTSVFGHALVPAGGVPAAWITEDVEPVPKNIYGVTKKAAEELCQLSRQDLGLPCIVLRTSRFFPEEDDRAQVRDLFADANVKANEYLYRRVEIEDAVEAHLLAAERAPTIGFGRYIISATTPFTPDDLSGLREDAPRVVARRFPGYAAEYARRDWTMFPEIERVYVNAKARAELGWQPRYDFAHVLDRLAAGDEPRSELARAVGAKGYHPESARGYPFL